MGSRYEVPAAAEDIAVVGLACLFPGAPDVATFWRNILAKHSAVTDPPPEAWPQDLFYDPGSDENDRVYCKKGGYLGPLALFDPIEHGIMPRAAEGGEPDQWLALHVARAALRDAGYTDGLPNRERAALILGKGTYANRGTMSVIQHGLVIDYTLRLLRALHPALTEDDLRLVRADLKRQLPRFDAETAPALIPNVSVGRIANRLDLMGPSYTIDAACASSLVAIDVAVKGLRSGEYDCALVGGMQAATPVPTLSLFCRLKALSLSQTIRPFDMEADGTILSEGVGMAVLKRRSDAERDGDRVYAYVKGAGVASDGRAVSVLAPRVEGEELALRRAYDAAGIAPATIGLIEAHGTGTPVGDAVEVEALRRVFGGRDGLPRCALGSVKSMIGHTMPAAGMAGFIKAVLSLHHKVLPPTINVTQPNPRLQLERTPFYLNTEPRPWVHGGEHPRRAGVNAFGFGGINAHVVVEEAAPAERPHPSALSWETELCLLAGTSRAEIIALGRDVSAAIARDPSLSLADLTFTLNARAQQHDVRTRTCLAIVAGSVADLARKIERAIARLSDPSCRRIRDVSGIYFFERPLSREGSLAFLFPGEGAQYPNMLADLCWHFPEVRESFDQMDRVLAQDPRGYVLSALVYPPPSFSDTERLEAEQQLWQMHAAVGAVYTANRGMYALLRAFGIEPDAMLGHSTGEFSAMYAAGMCNKDGYERKLNDLMRLGESASIEGKVPAPARLLAVGAPRDRVDAICRRFDRDVWVAMDNCQHQVVLVAQHDAADEVQEALRTEGLLYDVLSFDRPYHTPAFEAYAQELRDWLSAAIVRPPLVPLYSATTTHLFPADLHDVHGLAYRHLIAPVEFRRTVENMHADGVRLFVEVGPRGNLTAFVDNILAGRTYAAIPANVSRRSGLTQLNHLLAQLAAHGVALTLAPLYRHRQASALDLARLPESRQPVRRVGQLKIPTGAPDMRLSPDVAARLRSRVREADAGQSTHAGDTGATHSAAHPDAQSAPPRTGGPPVSRPDLPHATGTSADTSRPGTGGPPFRQADPSHPTGTPAADTSQPRPLGPPSGPPHDPSHAGSRPQTWGPPFRRPEATATTDVMAAYFRTMEQFLTTQQDMADLVAHIEGAPTNQANPGEGTPSRLPFIERVTDQRPGRTLVAHTTLSLDRYPALRDHAIGRRVSMEHPELPAFCIVPFTMLMEVMAEAAVMLVPATLVGMRDVRVHRWLALDRGDVLLEIRADVQERFQVRVQLFDQTAAAPLPLAEGVMVLADNYLEAPPAPPAPPAVLPDSHPYKWPPDMLYEKAMFHGPAFRGVASMDRVSAHAAEASLATLDPCTLLAAGRTEGLVTDFVLLDQPGQVVGFWASQLLDRANLVLPFRLEALDLYGTPLPTGERLRCTARLDAIGELELRSTLDVVGRDGRLWARFQGWMDRRFDVPERVVRFLLDPTASMLSTPWMIPPNADIPDTFTAFRIGVDAFPKGWLIAHGGLWSRVLAATLLGERERVLWNGLQLPEGRRLEWLLGRIAAKDSVREYLRRHHGLMLCPADVELLPDGDGRPIVQGTWTSRLSRVPLVSLSHAEGTALAIAGDSAGLRGIGVDLERLGRMRTDTRQAAFNGEEHAVLDRLNAAERNAWALRLWCAKEASAKALGKGFAIGWGAFRVREIDKRSGTVYLRVQPAGTLGIDMAVSTAQDGDWIVATCAAAAGEMALNDSYARTDSR
jgi:acyl transferase domain-containing protein/phosphopantetheinyl transferase